MYVCHAWHFHTITKHDGNANVTTTWQPTTMSTSQVKFDWFKKPLVNCVSWAAAVAVAAFPKCN